MPSTIHQLLMSFKKLDIRVVIKEDDLAKDTPKLLEVKSKADKETGITF